MISLLLSFYIGHAQQSKNIPTMTQQLDTFDIRTFDKNKNKVLMQYEFHSPNGNAIFQGESTDIYYEKIQNKTNNNIEYKEFYKSGKLKLKGQHYKGSLPIGEFRWYNDKGQCNRISNVDKYFTFTLEHVLQYCEDHKISENEKKITFWRTDSSFLNEDAPIFWTITYGIIPYQGKGSLIEVPCFIKITLDGKTGKESKREYKRVKIDTDWKLIGEPKNKGNDFWNKIFGN